MTCQPCVNTGCSRNEDVVPEYGSNTADDSSNLLSGFCQTSSSHEASLGSSQIVGSETNVELSELTEDDGSNNLAANDAKHGCTSEEASPSDTVEQSDKADGHSSWDYLWEQHYAERYWYYYDWFMQWLTEDRQMKESYIYTDRSDDDILQLATDNEGLLHNNHVETSEESLNVVESLLSGLLLTVVDLASLSCPTGGNGQKQKGNSGKKHKSGLFDICHTDYSDGVYVLVILQQVYTILDICVSYHK